MEEILVIDDDQNVLEVMNFLAFSRRGYDVKAASNGIEGIELLSNNSHFKAVFTDILMPGQDGNEVAKYVRENETMKNMPIIAITKHPSSAEEELFDSVVSKPFELQHLIGIFDSLP
jgi:CheY-like chemotaxis protein